MATQSRAIVFGARGSKSGFLRLLLQAPLIPAVILFMAVLAAVFASQLAPLDPNDVNLTQRLAPPAWLEAGSASHPLGTDEFGRDILSRLIWGARISMLVAVTCVVSDAAIGTIIGTIAGYFGGWIDSAIMRLIDVMLALPYLLIALVVVNVIGASLVNIIAIIVALRWAGLARIVRGEAIGLRSRDFVALAQVAGTGPVRILAQHIIPNVFNTVIVVTTLGVGSVILFESALSFLGVGVPPPTATWGGMVADGRRYIASAWWVSLFPGLAITLVCLAGNLFGDWLRDALDPRRRQI